MKMQSALGFAMLVFSLLACVKPSSALEARHTDENTSMALQQRRQAAEQGDAQAQYTLGLIYNEGIGVERDEAEAVKWWKKAARQGDAEAQAALREAYAGVGEGESAAVKREREAAKQGGAEAQYTLGAI
jgi:TPR repeat protein